jgi:hypothetical protein
VTERIDKEDKQDLQGQPDLKVRMPFSICINCIGPTHHTSSSLKGPPNRCATDLCNRSCGGLRPLLLWAQRCNASSSPNPPNEGVFWARLHGDI